MSGRATGAFDSLRWGADPTRVPYRVFTDREIYDLEQQRIFRGPFWSYVGLEVELPEAGDFRATFVGDTPIVVTRATDGRIHTFVNRCAHRGALVCSAMRGNARTLQCPYHQWSYDLAGKLVGVPFRRGVEGKGGYAKDFRVEDHALVALRVESYDGLLFATFDARTEPLVEFLGPAMTPWIDRIFRRPVKVLGYSRQVVNANWKLYAENTRDPYQASLLHLFHATFGMYRSTQDGGVTLDRRGRHDMLRALRRPEKNEVAAFTDAGLRSYAGQYRLADPSLLAGRPEHEGIHIHSLFPNLVIQQIQNTLATRQLLPKAADRFELVVTHLGYQDDDEEMTAIRIKQTNLIGPAGYVSMEDGYAAEIVQQAIVRDGDACSLLEAGGTTVEDQDNLVTETAIRGFWTHYRELLGGEPRGA